MHCKFNKQAVESYEDLRNRAVCSNSITTKDNFKDFYKFGMASWIQHLYAEETRKNSTKSSKEYLSDELIVVIANMIEGKSDAPVTQ